MLPKINRLKKKKDFESVFKNSKGVKIGPLSARATSNSLGLNRFGVVVSQKVSKKATARNKIRRRISEVIKKEVNNSQGGVDTVLITLPGFEKLNFQETKEVVVKILSKLKLIKNNV